MEDERADVMSGKYSPVQGGGASLPLGPGEKNDGPGMPFGSRGRLLVLCRDQ